MSVLHLLGTAGEGGAETFFVELVEALARAGVGEAAAIRKHPGREARLKAAGVRVRTLPFGGPLDILSRTAAAGFAPITRASRAPPGPAADRGWVAQLVRAVDS